MRLVELLPLLLLAACAGPSWSPPPAPLIPIPPAPRSAALEATAEPPLATPAPPAPATGGPPEPLEPAKPPAPQPTVQAGLRLLIEEPYKLGARPKPKSQADYQRDITDRRHWNDGGTGGVVDLPPPVGHPDPRVIVDVVKVRGGHTKSSLERTARQQHWINVVRCYRLGAYKDPHLRGKTQARIDIKPSGRVFAVKLLSTKLADGAVAKCIVDKLKTVGFVAARAGTRAWIDVQVGPGDDPLPPPEDAIVAGDGKLDSAAMRAGVEAGRGALEACYRAAMSHAPRLWGRIAVRFHVTEQGALDEAFAVESRFPDERMQQCVLRRARELQFPKPDGGGIRFVVPLRFFNDDSAHQPARQHGAP